MDPYGVRKGPSSPQGKPETFTETVSKANFCLCSILPLSLCLPPSLPLSLAPSFLPFLPDVTFKMESWGVKLRRRETKVEELGWMKAFFSLYLIFGIWGGTLLLWRLEAVIWSFHPVIPKVGVLAREREASKKWFQIGYFFVLCIVTLCSCPCPHKQLYIESFRRPSPFSLWQQTGVTEGTNEHMGSVPASSHPESAAGETDTQPCSRRYSYSPSVKLRLCMPHLGKAALTAQPSVRKSS